MAADGSSEIEASKPLPSVSRKTFLVAIGGVIAAAAASILGAEKIAESIPATNPERPIPPIKKDIPNTHSATPQPPGPSKS